MPVWLLRLVWKVRRKRAVRLHFKPNTGEERSLEGVLIGRWGGHYVLLMGRLLEDVGGEIKQLELGGALEVPVENVLLVQVLA